MILFKESLNSIKMENPSQKNILIDGMVSVIMPVYNAGESLRKSIESAMYQSYTNIEVLLVDDGSTDNSGKVCDEYALQDKRVKAIHKKNGGPSDARNVGIEHSRGEFMFFMDADDSIERNAIELLMKNQSKTQADVVAGDYRKVGNKILPSGLSTFFKESVLMDKKDIITYARAYLKKPNRFYLLGYSWGRLFKTSIIKKNNILFDINLRTFEDVAFNFHYLRYANTLYFLNEVIYNYTIYENYSSATTSIGDNPAKLLGYRQALVNVADFLRVNHFPESDIKKEVGHTYIFLSIIQLVRMCGQYNGNNKRKIFAVVKELVNDHSLGSYLESYAPSKGDSKILPVFMKLRLVWPIIWMCRYKAYKRYSPKRLLK